MSRKAIGIIVAVCAVAVAVFFGASTLKNKTPSQSEVQNAIVAALPDGAQIKTLEFEPDRKSVV